MTTPARPPETPEALELADSPPLLSPQQRAAVRAELSPLAADQARVRSAVWASLAAGELPRSAQRVEALMNARAGGAKLVGGSGLSSKLIALGVLVAGAAGLIGWGALRSSAPVASSAPTSPDGTGAPAMNASAEPGTSAPQTPPAHAGELAASRVRAVAPEPPAAEAAEVTELRVGKPGRARAGTHRTRTSKQAPVEPPASDRTPEASPQAEEPVSEPAPVAAREPVAEAVPRFDLAAELRLVRAASRALDRGDAQAALAQLQQYAQRYPAGALRVEASALRAMALCTAHASDADAERQHFLRDHASSALAERVKRACTGH